MALNVIQQSHSAHIIADAATFDSSASLVEVQSPIFTLERSGSAIAIVGEMTVAVLPGRGRFEATDSVEQILEQLPAMLRATQRAALAEGADADFFCVLIGWIEDTPRAWVVTSNPRYSSSLTDHVGRPEPFAVIDMPLLATWPRISLLHTLGPIESQEALDMLDVRMAGRTILDTQRRSLQSVEGNLRHVVGGFGELASVTRAGVKRTRLVDWQDPVGKPIAIERSIGDVAKPSGRGTLH